MQTNRVLPATPHERGWGLRDWWNRNQRKLIPYIFLTPNLVVFTIFVFVPIVYSLWMSFHEWRGIDVPHFIGLQNFVEIAQDGVFWVALKNTLVYAAGVVPLSMGLGLLAALGLNVVLPGRTVLRTIYFIPVVVSAVVVGTLSSWIFNDNYGIVNSVLRQSGFARVNWLTSPQMAMITLIVSTVWIRLGFCMIVYLAGLQGIPHDYLDAAQVDGATAWQRFRLITFPLLRPSTFLLLILNVIYSFEAFDLVYVMTGGGPGYSTTVLPVYIYESAFELKRYGYANALGLILMVIILVFTLIQWRISQQGDS
jgi:multiple sugar transport system permease protein